MREIIEGLQRFQHDIYPAERDRFRRLAKSQQPLALFITCSDSRIMPGLITDTRPGQLFVIRNAGNIVPAHGEMIGGVSATIEYAVMALNVPDIIVCGHSDCGALKGVLHPEKLQALPAVRAWLHQAERARVVVEENYQCEDESEKLWALIRENAAAQMDHLITHPSVASRVRKGTLRLHCWVFDIGTGEVTAFDREAQRFRPFQEVYVNEAAALNGGGQLLVKGERA
jgi:carbonic anhydrase